MCIFLDNQSSTFMTPYHNIVHNNRNMTFSPNRAALVKRELHPTSPPSLSMALIVPACAPQLHPASTSLSKELMVPLFPSLSPPLFTCQPHPSIHLGLVYTHTHEHHDHLLRPWCGSLECGTIKTNLYTFRIYLTYYTGLNVSTGIQ